MPMTDGPGTVCRSPAKPEKGGHLAPLSYLEAGE